MVLDRRLHYPCVCSILHTISTSLIHVSILGGALMSFLPISNRSGCLAGIYLVNAVVAPLPVLYAVSGDFRFGHRQHDCPNEISL